MASLFAGTDRLICSALGIQRREQLNDRALRIEPLSEERAIHLVNGLYERMARNVPARIEGRSEQLWESRRATDIADHHRGQETILEKAVANLAEQGHMPGWFNQCPVASGISDPHNDNRRAVDLVHLCSDTARLIELKWASNTPVHALFQVLEYGLAYVLARLRKSELRLNDRQLMHVRHTGLEVVGPGAFFGVDSWPHLFAILDQTLARFAEDRSGGAWTMSLEARAFPDEFHDVPLPDGKAVNARCRTATLTAEGHMVRDAFSRLAPASTNPQDRFLPGVPGADIERILDAAPGDEIGRGKFDHPESSAALAANAFGFFLHRAGELPPLPGCPETGWPARSLAIEATVRFPWPGGRHPVLDCLVTAPSALIGIESKRFEPFRGHAAAVFSEAYSRPVWGDHMKGFEQIRDSLRDDARRYGFLDAAQLVKHAFALRSQVHRSGVHCGLKPILFYIHADPEYWPRTEERVDVAAKAGHRDEIARFARLVEGDEVVFVSCPYQRLLEAWRHDHGQEIRAHAAAVMARFAP